METVHSRDVKDPNFISREELAALAPAEIEKLRQSVILSSKINNSFVRSQWFPFPRDLCFPIEKPLFKKWASGREMLVEIGVFEGTSALTFRKVMAPHGVLHLIDPFIAVPDSGLTARPWLAQLNVTLSRRGRVVWHRDYSFSVVKMWRTPIDFLFIDGDHRLPSCQKDWETWSPFMKVGGVVIFHDARFGRGGNGSWDGWPGPSMVVNENFRGPGKLPNWEIVEEAGTAVAVQRVW